MDCENCDYCKFANRDCDKIAISQTTQFNFLTGHRNCKTTQFDFLDGRNCEDCENCEIVGFYWQDLEKEMAKCGGKSYG